MSIWDFSFFAIFLTLLLELHPRAVNELMRISLRRLKLHHIITDTSRINFTTCDFNSGENVFKIISCHHLLLNIMKLDDILITLNCFGSHWGWYEKTIQAKKRVDHFWKKYLGSFEELSISFISHITLSRTPVGNLEDILCVRRTGI